MPPDLDDTLPGRTPALDAFITRMGLAVDDDPDDRDEIGDLEDTVVGSVVPQESQRPVPLVEPSLRDTAPIEPREPGTAASFGYRLGGQGAPDAIDSVIYLGRRPSTPRITGGALPTLVTVRSPNQLVSSTHLELRQEGGTIVATDLRSTNGTTVTVPGRDPRTLRQGESLVVTPGTLIDIGDENIVEIVSLGRLRAPAASSTTGGTP